MKKNNKFDYKIQNLTYLGKTNIFLLLNNVEFKKQNKTKQTKER